MKISPGVEVVWSLAGQEMQAALVKEIEPEHFLCAILKFAQMETGFPFLNLGAPLKSILQNEQDQLKGLLNERSLNASKLEGELRQAMEKGKVPYQGQAIHRSPASRRLFDLADRFAMQKDGIMYVPDLLQAILKAPSPTVQKVINSEQGGQMGRMKAGVSAASQHWFRDLIEGGRTMNTEIDPTFQPQIDVLVWALQSPTKPTICLVCSPKTNPGALLAHVVLSELVSTRIVTADLKQLQKHDDQLQAEDGWMEELTQETDQALKTFYYLDTLGEKSGKVAALLEKLRPAIEHNPPRLILAIQEELFNPLMDTLHMDGFLRIIWLHRLEPYRLPRQL